MLDLFDRRTGKSFSNEYSDEYARPVSEEAVGNVYKFFRSESPFAGNVDDEYKPAAVNQQVQLLNFLAAKCIVRYDRSELFQWIATSTTMDTGPIEDDWGVHQLVQYIVYCFRKQCDVSVMINEGLHRLQSDVHYIQGRVFWEKMYKE